MLRADGDRLLGLSIGVISAPPLARGHADRVESGSASIAARNLRSTHPGTTSVAPYTLRLLARLIQALTSEIRDLNQQITAPSPATLPAGQTRPPRGTALP